MWVPRSTPSASLIRALDCGPQATCGGNLYGYREVKGGNTSVVAYKVDKESSARGAQPIIGVPRNPAPSGALCGCKQVEDEV